MKRVFLLVVAVASIFTLNAQYKYSEMGLITSRSGYLGNARSEAMGNSFGAVGGNSIAMSINPAGIGVYRSDEFSISANVVLNDNSSDYSGFRSSSDHTRFTIDNLSYILADTQNEGRISLAAGFGYNRLNNYRTTSVVYGNEIDYSMSESFAEKAYLDQLSSFETTAAYETYLINGVGADGFQSTFDPTIGDNTDQQMIRNTYGSQDEVTFSVAANLDHTLYFGATFSFLSLDYEHAYSYKEDIYGPEYNDGTGDIVNYGKFDYSQGIITSGVGFQGKFGLIYKPIQPLRVGVAVHTPVGYSMNEKYSASMWSYGMDFDNPQDEYSEKADFNEYDYKISTPWRYIFSAAYVLGKYVIVSADYEVQDFSKIKLKDEFTNSTLGFEEDNAEIKELYSSANTLRIGGEYRPTAEVSIRAGAQFVSDPYRGVDDYQGVISSTTNIYSGGFGYRVDNISIDFAYSNSMKKETEYLFVVNDGSNGNIAAPVLSKIKEQHLKLSFTYRY